MKREEVTAEEYYIKTEVKDKEFNEHLILHQNKRIVFSSKFGNGKTTFLKKFFNSNPEYNVIHLYPVNYSVASNEDILELIKYDILFELLTEKIELTDSIETFTSIAKSLLLNNKTEILKILTPLLSFIPMVGDAAKDSIDRLIEFSKIASEKFEEDNKGEYDVIVEYLQEFTQKKGSIYEENFYSQLINDLVDRLKCVGVEGDNKKQSVLIIDDFDRIDPEHIFRLLNVFAAHQDINHQGNKFGFDKVIVVCDIDNIRSIFHHKYGSNTDFNGYIDKFYSVDVYKFNMMPELNEEVDELLATIKGDKNLNQLFWPNNSTSMIFEIMEWLLKAFVSQEIINVRNVVKLRENKYILNHYHLGLPKKRFFNTQFWGISLFNFLKSIFGDYDELMLALSKFSKSYDKAILADIDIEWVLNYILIPIHCIDEKEIFINIPLLNNKDDIACQTKMTQRDVGNQTIYVSHLNTEATEDMETIRRTSNIYELFIRTYMIAYNKGILK